MTGAGRGIGRAIALRLGAQGMAVAVHARTRPQLEETAQLVERLGGRALAVAGDATDPAVVTELVAATPVPYGQAARSDADDAAVLPA